MQEEKNLSEAFNQLGKDYVDFAKSLLDAIRPMIQPIIDGCCRTIKDITSKNKITKKRFIKLLRSRGVHRDYINKIIKGNRDPYTYMRFIDELKKIDERKNK